VKNFPPNTTEEQLHEIFSPYGQIDSTKLFSREGEALYAFICFKNPEDASRAKAELHQKNVNGKHLYINLYEIKENRILQQEEIRDKQDFQNYTRANTNFSDALSKPEMITLLQ
jgi:polyadenylate-binding protein